MHVLLLERTAQGKNTAVLITIIISLNLNILLIVFNTILSITYFIFSWRGGSRTTLFQDQWQMSSAGPGHRLPCPTSASPPKGRFINPKPQP